VRDMRSKFAISSVKEERKRLLDPGCDGGKEEGKGGAAAGCPPWFPLHSHEGEKEGENTKLRGRAGPLDRKEKKKKNGTPDAARRGRNVGCKRF